MSDIVVNKENGRKVVECAQGIDATVAKLLTILEEKGLTIVANIDHRAAAQNLARSCAQPAL